MSSREHLDASRPGSLGTWLAGQISPRSWRRCANRSGEARRPPDSACRRATVRPAQCMRVSISAAAHPSRPARASAIRQIEMAAFLQQIRWSRVDEAPAAAAAPSPCRSRAARSFRSRLAHRPVGRPTSRRAATPRDVAGAAEVKISMPEKAKVRTRAIGAASLSTPQVYRITNEWIIARSPTPAWTGIVPPARPAGLPAAGRRLGADRAAFSVRPPAVRCNSAPI